MSVVQTHPTVCAESSNLAINTDMPLYTPVPY
jgi:hypothetical protein